MKWCNSFHETYRWILYKYLALLLLLVAACDTYVEDKRSVDFEPIYLPNSEEEDKGSDLGTIYLRRFDCLRALYKYR